MKHKPQPPLSPEKYIRTRARTLPVGDCYINENWQDSGTALALVSRQHANGHITFALFMVDLFCLGVKDTLWKFNEHPLDFNQFLEDLKASGETAYDLQKTTYALIHNIVYGAIEFAGESGFYPHKSFDLTGFLLEEDDDHIPFIEIDFGHKGKPLYISNPDNPTERNSVISRLEKTVGKGNFYYITEGDAEDFLNPDNRDDSDEDDSEEDDSEEDDSEEDDSEEDDSDRVDYSDPDVKSALIREMIELTENFDRESHSSLEEIIYTLKTAELIFLNYMVTGEEYENAYELIDQMFDFSVQEEIFSDEMIFGNSSIPKNSDLIRKEAIHLYEISAEKKPARIMAKAEKLIKKYPGVPVFQYLYLKALMLESGQQNNTSTLKSYAETYPDYLPIAHLCLQSGFFHPSDDEKLEFPEHLHLMNFYPGKREFCFEEVSVYANTLIVFLGINNEILKLLILFDIIETLHPDMISVEEIIIGKLLIVPHVIAWCEGK